MIRFASLVTLCGLAAMSYDPVIGAVVAAAPWPFAGLRAIGRRPGPDAAGGERPAAIAAMAQRFRDGLDRNADMALRAWRATVRRSTFGATDQTALMAELLTYCQHSLIRDDMFALADHGTTLTEEFDAWLGADLARHVETHILPRTRTTADPDPRLMRHAREHGWLAPSTLALARAGTPLTLPEEAPAPQVAPTEAAPAL